ncbi:hypothetical protein [Paraburkholderia sp.]|uniref:hypothetical protein n=1 Tax=Paraburkholderia sp. TaxID=1926495 RepID=UPI0025DFEB3C|nr:hypothetical protein [Paraburkholderia sp.]
MNIFLGYFVWGLILAAPLWWIWWRFNLSRWLPRWALPARSRPVVLPPQLDALVVRGKRRAGTGEARR